MCIRKYGKYGFGYEERLHRLAQHWHWHLHKYAHITIAFMVVISFQTINFNENVRLEIRNWIFVSKRNLQCAHSSNDWNTFCMFCRAKYGRACTLNEQKVISTKSNGKNYRKFNYQNALLRQIEGILRGIATSVGKFIHICIRLSFVWFFEAQDTGKAAAIQSHQTL